MLRNPFVNLVVVRFSHILSHISREKVVISSSACTVENISFFFLEIFEYRGYLDYSRFVLKARSFGLAQIRSQGIVLKFSLRNRVWKTFFLPTLFLLFKKNLFKKNLSFTRKTFSDWHINSNRCLHWYLCCSWKMFILKTIALFVHLLLSNYVHLLKNIWTICAI